MSRLDELIQEYCPNGVEYKELRKITTISRGGNLQKKDFCDSGVPCIHYGQIYTKYGLFAKDTYSFVSQSVAIKQKYAQPGDIIMAVTSENVDDICKCVAWLGKEKVAVSGHTAIIQHNQNPKYMAYYFHTEMFKKERLKYIHGTKVMELTPDKLNEIVIPVPPLPVQEEIVRILDSFAELTAELQDKLQEELQARKRQYGYYKDRLLACAGNVPMVALGDLCLIKGRIGFRGYTQKDIVEKGNGAISLSPGNIVFNHLNLDECKYISWEKYYESPEIMIEEHDVILCKTGSTVGKVTVVEDLPEKATLNPQLVVLKDLKCNCRYLFYQLSGSIIQQQIRSSAGVGSVPSISQKALSKILIPLPSIEQQEKLVDILDGFDTLCNDLTSSLPAEIEARQKQYEYYRDKLLTFKPLP